LPFLHRQGLLGEGFSLDQGWLAKLAEVLRERSQTLLEVAEGAAPFFGDSVTMDPQAARKFLTSAIRPHLSRLLSLIEQSQSFDHAGLEESFKTVLAETGLAMGKLAQPVRVALTGRTVSPGIFDVMILLGRERTLARLRKAIDLIV
jgi:glutamyl-tRNA synthetase